MQNSSNETINSQHNKNNNSITLSDILRVLKKNWILICIITVVVFAIGAIYTFAIAKPTYKSTSSIVVAIPEKAGAEIGDTTQIDITSSRNITYTIIDTIPSKAILEGIAKDNNLTYSKLKNMVSVSANQNSFLIRISVVSGDAELSKKLANEIKDKVISEAGNSTEEEKTSLFYAKGYIAEVDKATTGSYNAPNKKLYLIVSLLAGVVLAAVVVFIKEFASTKYQTVEEIANIGLPILNTLPDDKSKKKNNNCLIEPSPRNFEPYNRLISNIKFSNVDNPYRVVMFTSSITEELKTTVVSNVAYTIAHNGNKVLIIDLDTRKPRIHKAFNITKEDGIVEYLDDQIDKNKLIKHTDKNVDIITVGKEVVNPITLLESEKLKKLIDELKKEYEYIAIDTPPLTACNDASIISKFSDAVVFNVAINQAKKKEIKISLEQLKDARANVIGINITKANNKDRGEYYYDYGDNN